MRFLEKDAIYKVIEVISLRHNLHDCTLNFAWISTLQQVSIGAYLHHMTHEPFVFKHGERNDMNVGKLLGNYFGGLDAIFHGHAKIHQYNVGLIVGTL